MQYLVKERKAKEKMDGFGEKTWRWLEQGSEMKMTESYGEDFQAVVTPNRKKPKEEVAVATAHYIQVWLARGECNRACNFICYCFL